MVKRGILAISMVKSYSFISYKQRLIGEYNRNLNFFADINYIPLHTQA